MCGELRRILLAMMSELWYKLVETSSVCPLITHLSGLLVRPGLGQGREVSGVADAGEAGLRSGLRGLDGQGRGRAPEQKVLQFHIYLVFQYTVLNVLSAYPTVGRLMGFSTSPVLLTDIVLITRKSI